MTPNSDPLTVLRGIVLEGQPVELVWHPARFIRRRAVGILAWEGQDLSLMTEMGVPIAVPLREVLSIHDAASGRRLWPPKRA